LFAVLQFVMTSNYVVLDFVFPRCRWSQLVQLLGLVVAHFTYSYFRVILHNASIVFCSRAHRFVVADYFACEDTKKGRNLMFNQICRLLLQASHRGRSAAALAS
jgi:hypothetical protein